MKISTICFPIKDKTIFLSNKKRGFGAGFLNGYGGKKQPDDTSIEAAAIRELKEESGIVCTPENLEKVAVIDFFEEENLIFECHIYFSRDWKGDFKESDEMAIPEAFDIDNMPYDKMWDGDKVWLPLVCAGEKIIGKCHYEKGMARLVKFEHEPLK